MDKIIAIPLREVNGVEFGMSRGEVRSVLGKAKEFRKTKFSKNTTDDFGYCHVFYDINDRCEAIEIFNEVEVVVNDTVIFPSSIKVAQTVFKDLIEDEGCYISTELAVGITLDNDKMESILFGTKGYY